MWSVYIVRCGDDSLYTGIAIDVDRRIKEHQNGKGSRYLRGRGTLQLVFQMEIGTRSQASKIEYRIKKLSKARKESLITNDEIFEDMRILIRTHTDQKQLNPHP